MLPLPHIYIMSCFRSCRMSKKDIRGKYACPSFSYRMLYKACHASSFAPFFFWEFFPLIPLAVPFHFLPALCTPSLECRFFLTKSFRLHLPALLHPYCMLFVMLASVSLTLPSFFLVISLSYVCPSLCVCVPPLFVSNSFSREIRDAYLVLLSSTSAAALSYIERQWPHHQNAHSLMLCTSIVVKKARSETINPALHSCSEQHELKTSLSATVIDC